MIKWGQIDRATNIVSKIYAHATEEQVALKVQVLQAAVRQSVEIARTTTIWQRLRMLVLKPVNRRALSVYTTSINYRSPFSSDDSCRMRHAGFPATLRLQYPHVLLRHTIQADWIRPTDRRRAHCIRHQLYIYARRAQIYRHHRPSADYGLDISWHDLRFDAGEYIIPL